MAGIDNLAPPFESGEKARELGKKGGIASGKAKRAKKTLADTLRKVLQEKIAKGEKLTRQEAIAIKAVKRLYDDPKMSDLKILAEILGETKQTVELTGTQLVINTDDKTKEIIQKGLED